MASGRAVRTPVRRSLKNRILAVSGLLHPFLLSLVPSSLRGTREERGSPAARDMNA